MNEYPEQLLTGLKKRDIKAYEEIFFKYHGRLVLFARKFTGDLELAQDIVQDAFLTLWEKSDSLTINHHPKAYLFQAVKNKALNHKRHLQVKQSARQEMISKINALEKSVYYDINDPFYSLLELEMEQRIEKGINSMPEKMQDCV